MDFRLRSERHKSNFKKHYFFLVINALIIPLFGLTSVETIYGYFSSTNVNDIGMQAI
jgi:hypothetical protein